MRFCVVGAGAIGGTIGARLAAAGHAVSILARGAHLDAIRSGGLCFVDDVAGASGAYRLAASADPAELGAQECIFLAMKAHQAPAALAAVGPLLGPDTVVVPAINGLPWWYFEGVGGRFDGLSLRALDPDGVMAQLLPCARIIGCVVHFAAELQAPGRVHCTAGRRLLLGEADPARSVGKSARLQALASALDAAGFAVECSHDIRRDIWIKLIGNLSFNPIAALTGYRMDQICADEDLLDLIRAILREGAAVAACLGIDVGITPDQRIAIARQLGAARISMLQDLENRRSLEIEPIVGAVVELAQRVGIEVPATRAAYALIRARARALGLPQA